MGNGTKTKEDLKKSTETLEEVIDSESKENHTQEKIEFRT